MTSRFATPFAFKQSLEQRLKSATATGADLARRRQLVVFNRFLARVTEVCGDGVTVKGGLALELRLSRARTTKDVDLRMTGTTLISKLRACSTTAAVSAPSAASQARSMVAHSELTSHSVIL